MVHYQACFTRISGQDSGAGWQTVNVSPGLPQESVSAFSRFQNGNITPPSFDSEDATSQIVTELQNDGNFVFYTLIKCNAAADDKGRPIMFAHSFVFPLNEFVQTPQEVLGIKQSNFAFEVSQTVSPPPTLTRKNPFTLSEAVTSLSLTADSYATLVQCVFFILDGKAKNSLHIICDCAPDTIRGFMTCIYAALPYEFRKKITFSTYEFQSGAVKTIIFDRKIKNTGDYHIIPQTGENNVISDVVLKRWGKYEFMRFVPDNFTTTADHDQYFKHLEDTLSLFGSTHTTSLDLYKIACDLILDDQNKDFTIAPETLAKRLNEFLSAPINHPYIDQQIQLVLGDIIEYNVILNDVLSEKLCKKLEATRDQDLIDCGHVYNSEKISRMNVEDGAIYLFEGYKNRQSESFIQIRKLLDRDIKGRDILNYLYTNLIPSSIPKNEDSIISFYEETTSLFDKREIQNSLCQMCAAYFKTIINDKINPRLLMLSVVELLEKVLQERSDLIEKVKCSVIQTYWDRFSYDTLLFDRQDVYSNVLTPEIQKHSKVSRVNELLKVFRFFEMRDVDSFRKQVTSLFSSESTVFSGTERLLLAQKLKNTCLDNREIYGGHELDVWLTVAFKLCNKENPISFLITNHIQGMYHFEEAFQDSRLLMSERKLKQFGGCLEEYVQSKSDGYKIAADALRVIKDHEKRVKQDIKKQQREEQRATREASDETSLLAKGINIFKKKKQDSDPNDWR